MIVKFFNQGKNLNNLGPVRYLLGKEFEREGAILERGSPEVTESLIHSCDYKTKYTSGCLSFTEPLEHFTRSELEYLMDDFEKALLPGLDKSDYDCLWVTHTDKGRLELNFVVPRINLRTGKQLNVYYHAKDESRIDAWKKIQNITFGLHDPDDPANQRQIERNAQYMPESIKASKESIHALIEEAIVNGAIRNRDELINFLLVSGVELADTKNPIKPKSISIKNPNGKRPIRLQGEIYSDQFDPDKDATGQIIKSDKRADLGRKVSVAKQVYTAASSERLERARDFYARASKRKAKENQKRHAKARQHKRDGSGKGNAQRRKPENEKVADNSHCIDSGIDSSLSERLDAYKREVGSDSSRYTTSRNHAPKTRPTLREQLLANSRGGHYDGNRAENEQGFFGKFGAVTVMLGRVKTYVQEYRRNASSLGTVYRKIVERIESDRIRQSQIEASELLVARTVKLFSNANEEFGKTSRELEYASEQIARLSAKLSQNRTPSTGDTKKTIAGIPLPEDDSWKDDPKFKP
ncbi:relaxase/mobilization nuclease domain-containing protein [Vibrio alginolyticus]|uniref:relaxase/mobilization nuclease domain-containing protein n=1 Tax=Vibrio alginolyticus TaxID=663 RepID=UPI003D7DA268